MHRAVICNHEPWLHIPRLREKYSIMIVNPDSTHARMKYLLDNSDYSLLVTDDKEFQRRGGWYQDEAMVLYTSGTTGDSKFYSFSQAQIDLKLEVFREHLGIDATDRYFGVMPLWHAHGLGFYLATEYIGCDREFGSVKDLKKLQAFQPTIVSAIPDVLRAMLNLRLENLKYMRSASSQLSDDLFRRLKDKFHVSALEGFGMTETLGLCMSNPVVNQRIGTVGLPWLDARLDTESHLWLRAPWCFTDQWFDTGDLAEQDEQGYYRIMGRSVDQLNIRGKKFNPVSIERQLIENVTGIEKCVVFGNENLKCLYVGVASVTSVRNFLISLDQQLRPAFLDKVDEIPVNNGKISRTWLHKNYHYL